MCLGVYMCVCECVSYVCEVSVRSYENSVDP